MKLSQDSSLRVTRFGDWEKRKIEKTDIFGVCEGTIEYFNHLTGQAFTFALDYGNVNIDLRTLVVDEEFLTSLVNRLKTEGRASPVLAFLPNALQENIPWEMAYVLTDDALPEGQAKLKLFYIEKTGKNSKEVVMCMSESESQEFFLKLKNSLVDAESRILDEDEWYNIEGLSDCGQVMKWYGHGKCLHEVISEDERLIGSQISSSDDGGADNFELLSFSLKTFREFIIFPDEMIRDMLSEIEHTISFHKSCMQNLATALLNHDEDIQKKCFQLLECDFSGYGELLINWINSFEQSSRFSEALAFCQVFPESHEDFMEICQTTERLLIKSENASSRDNEQKTTLDQDEKSLNYLKQLFRNSWQTAKKTCQQEDFIIAKHFLESIKNPEGFGVCKDPEEADEINMMINMAEEIRTNRIKYNIEHMRLENENNILRDEIRQLKQAKSDRHKKYSPGLWDDGQEEVVSPKSGALIHQQKATPPLKH